VGCGAHKFAVRVGLGGMQGDERALSRERYWVTMSAGVGSAAAPARRCCERQLVVGARIRSGVGSAAFRGPWLPHHKLFAYELCLSLVTLVAKVRIADAQLRAQARKSAASAALNCAEGAARQTRTDKSRAYSIALCECCEACAAIEIAGALGACSAADVQAVVLLGTRVKNILSRLVR
jgi:four helix bundle protein